MRTLAIETSGPNCSIALFDGDEVVAVREELVGRGHAERLIPWIAKLPGGGRAERILVGCGPGSFTGVRVGIAAARGLALGWGSEIAGASSLALIAAQFCEGSVTVAVSAGHGELFVQDYSQGLADGPLASVPPCDAGKRHVHQLVVGSGAALLVAARGFGEARDTQPSARYLQTVFRRDGALPPTPIYGRGADAKPMLAA